MSDDFGLKLSFSWQDFEESEYYHGFVKEVSEKILKKVYNSEKLKKEFIWDYESFKDNILRKSLNFVETNEDFKRGIKESIAKDIFSLSERMVVLENTNCTYINKNYFNKKEEEILDELSLIRKRLDDIEKEVFEKNGKIPPFKNDDKND